MFRLAPAANKGFATAFRTQHVRCFSKKIPEMGDHKLQLSGVAGRIAHQVLNATYQTGADLKKTLDFFREVKTHLKAEPQLGLALSAKQLEPAEKLDLMENIVFKGMKSQSEVGKAVLMKMVEDNEFERQYSDVCTDYERLVYAELGITPAEVVSAVALTKDQEKKISTKLAGLVPKGQTVEMSCSVDPSILGGLVVRLGERAQDLSVTSRLSQLELGIRAVA